MLHIELKPTSPVPLFQQIHDQVVAAIARGDLVDGAKLDSVRTVAAEFGINPATVQKAYDLLKEDGLIATSPRSASKIMSGRKPTSQQEAQLLSDLERIAARATAQGFSKKDITSLVKSALGSVGT